MTTRTYALLIRRTWSTKEEEVDQDGVSLV